MKDKALKFYINFKFYIFPAVVALSCLILIIFVIYPQAEKLISNQEVQDDLATRSEFLEAKAVFLEDINEEQLGAKLQYALTSYPTDRDFGNIIGIIRNTANENGFNVSGMTINPLRQENEAATLKYSVKIQAGGSKVLLTRFTKAIESQPRIMKIGSMEVTKSPQGDTVNVFLDIAVFYGSAPQSFGGVDTSLPNISQQDEELLATLASFIPAAPAVQTVPTPSSPRGKANPFE